MVVRLHERHRSEELGRAASRTRSVVAARVRQRQAAVILRRVERGDGRRAHTTLAVTARTEADILARFLRRGAVFEPLEYVITHMRILKEEVADCDSDTCRKRIAQRRQLSAGLVLHQGEELRARLAVPRLGARSREQQRE